MTSFAVLAIVKATLVCGLAFFFSRVGRRARASLRHMSFALAFVALAGIPAATLVLPAAITIPVLTITSPDHWENPAVAQLKLNPAATASAAPAVQARSTGSRTMTNSGITIAEVATAIWLAGVTLFLLPIVTGLAERLGLVAHIGSKDFPIYALALSRSDGRLGPRITRSSLDCRSNPVTSSPCGLSSGAGKLVGRGVTIRQLVKVWPNHLGGAHSVGLDRRLIDATGLSGAFDFTLEWMPDAAPRTTRALSETAPPSPQFRFFANPVEAKAPNFLAALHEQLGLMLEARWAPQPVLVIDSIERPAGK